MQTKTTTEQGRALRSLREMAGLTAEDVAREAGVSAAYLSRVENGKAAPTPRWVGTVSVVIASHLASAAA